MEVYCCGDRTEDICLGTTRYNMHTGERVDGFVRLCRVCHDRITVYPDMVYISKPAVPNLPLPHHVQKEECLSH